MKCTIKAFNYLVGFVCMFSLCAIDSASLWPLVTFVASAAYLIFLAWRSGEAYYKPEWEEEE